MFFCCCCCCMHKLTFLTPALNFNHLFVWVFFFLLFLDLATLNGVPMFLYLSFSTMCDLSLPKCALYLTGSLFCEGWSSDPHNQLCQHGLCVFLFLFFFLNYFLGANISLFSIVICFVLFLFFSPLSFHTKTFKTAKLFLQYKRIFFLFLIIRSYWSTEQFSFLIHFIKYMYVAKA